MSAHILSKVHILGKFVDERFLEHRRRSSSVAGIFTACLAMSSSNTASGSSTSGAGIW